MALKIVHIPNRSIAQKAESWVKRLYRAEKEKLVTLKEMEYESLNYIMKINKINLLGEILNNIKGGEK